MEGNRIHSALDEIQGLVNGLDKQADAELVHEITEKIRQLKSQIPSGDRGMIDFEVIVDSLNEGIYICDSDAVIRYVNPAYLRHTLFKAEELIGQGIQTLLDKGVFREVRTLEVLKTKQSTLLMGYIRTVEGHHIYGYCTVKPLLDEKEDVKNVIVTLYDTDKLKARYDEYSRSSQDKAPVRINDTSLLKDGEPVIGNSEALQSIYRMAERVAQTDATVLITGESGVGKEGVADYIHAKSKRSKKPYIKVNCAAISPQLLESELFGYEQGAFTGAKQKGKVGLFEAANYGTILLDEVGDIQYELQSKLLRLIQQKEIVRVGGNTPIRLDVRIIASTNADLKKRITENAFREDLYYRLCTIPIQVPPLRERREDIPDLINYFHSFYQGVHKRSVEFSDEYYKLFMRYDWPGNIRQLKNIVEYLVICSEVSYLSDVAQLKRILDINDESPDMILSLSESMASYEKMIITQSLKSFGTLRKTARMLNIDPATLSRKIKKFGIQNRSR